jgi:superfamily I DNA/RNA helicase
MEVERRLAYVAFTRAQQHLYVQHDKEKPSPFLAASAPSAACCDGAESAPSRRPAL